MLEAIGLCERITGESLDYTISPENRIGDHRWWVSDNRPFEADYPEWRMGWTSTEAILRDIYEQNVERWSS